MRAEQAKRQICHEAAVAALQCDLAKLCEAEIGLRKTVEDLETRIAAASDLLAWMRSRLTWRLTVPLRLLSRQQRRIRQRILAMRRSA